MIAILWAGNFVLICSEGSKREKKISYAGLILEYKVYIRSVRGGGKKSNTLLLFATYVLNIFKLLFPDIRTSHILHPGRLKCNMKEV